MPVLKRHGEELAWVLKDKINSRSAVVAVVGLGYVGLPMAVEQARAGFPVVGIDRDEKKVEQVNSGHSYIRDVPGEVLQTLVKGGRLRAHHSFDPLGGADVVIICVPTPLKSMKQPDLSFVISAAGEVAGRIRPGQLISLESTTFPGTTQEIVLPILQSGGYTAGEDFFLVFSPERVDPGNKCYTAPDISKVVGGVTPVCLDVACAFYRQSIKKVVPVSSPAVAEMTKIFENTYRAVNIALVNEFMLLCDRMGLDIWEVVEAAATKPFGIHTFYPGPGVGGHCIPVDPFYLAWRARDYGFHTRFIDLAGEINAQAPEYVVQKLIGLLNRQKKCLNGAKILVLGVAYKKDVDDVRESPATKIVGLLLKNGAAVSYYDPYVPVFRLSQKEAHCLESVPLSAEEVAGADCVLILTDHSCVDYQWVVEHAGLILDARNATRAVRRGREKITRI
ncbi:MAG: nucleotide sugar dehydrogenase [Pelotomaculum sp.]|uniref:UDP-N-acetyl-D-mannosaminuronate dehydrogenase n=1 Tax=Pelotomaculum thermopropionicum (strain DSM 13744 / JCM 10971 / SI) TaxID=370438 RepID=A5D3D4_PELTS|nr:nucleotide sugar dehydrogenase [Pelotomaculum sp.]BAF59257.1 UDP-N-acetyl-D-mannosaminuronate dehydrogenase [Pelotomaculum thermopropionicum SI]